MPTHDSEHEVNYYKETRAKAIVSRNGKLIPEVFEVLDLIKERNLTLATGHVTPEEVLMIMAEAKSAASPGSSSPTRCSGRSSRTCRCRRCRRP